MHREYENLIKNLNNPTLPNNQPMNDTYMISISAANFDAGHGVPATTHQDRVPQPGEGHGSDDR